MSCYLGFEPTDRPNYYFVSYNSEDVDRITPIASSLFHASVPLWYDFGLEYGEKWESQISGKIMGSQALVLFFTKGILTKQNSYVRKEYEMATKFFNRKVFVVMMDKIANKDVPFDKVPWWIDVQEHQSIDISDMADLSAIVSRIAQALGMASNEERMNRLIENYKSLYDSGQHDEAERYLEDYLHGRSLAEKAHLICNIVSHRVEGLRPMCVPENTGSIGKPLINHVGQAVEHFVEWCRTAIGDTVITIGNSFVFHRGNRGDAHVINIWRDEEPIFTLGGLIEVNDMHVYYDDIDDILYVCFCSEHETIVGGELETECFQSVITVEHPQTTAVCNVFKDDV